MAEEYIPTAIRDRKDASEGPMYAVTKHWRTPGSFEHGPFKEEAEALEMVGDNNDSVIVRIISAGKSEIVWRWRYDRWVKGVTV